MQSTVKLSAKCSAILILMGLVWPGGVCAAADRQKAVIAKVSKGSQEIKLRKKILKKRFQDGGVITELEVARLDKGYYLLRAGEDANGTPQTEIIPLRLRSGKLLVLEELLLEVAKCSGQSCPRHTEGSGEPSRDREQQDTFGYTDSPSKILCRPKNDVTGCYCVGSDPVEASASACEKTMISGLGVNDIVNL